MWQRFRDKLHKFKVERGLPLREGRDWMGEAREKVREHAAYLAQAAELNSSQSYEEPEVEMKEADAEVEDTGATQPDPMVWEAYNRTSLYDEDY